MATDLNVWKNGKTFNVPVLKISGNLNSYKNFIWGRSLLTKLIPTCLNSFCYVNVSIDVVNNVLTKCIMPENAHTVSLHTLTSNLASLRPPTPWNSNPFHGGRYGHFQELHNSEDIANTYIDIKLPIRDLLSVGTNSSFVLMVVMGDMPFGYPILNYWLKACVSPTEEFLVSPHPSRNSNLASYYFL